MWFTYLVCARLTDSQQSTNNLWSCVFNVSTTAAAAMAVNCKGHGFEAFDRAWARARINFYLRLAHQSGMHM